MSGMISFVEPCRAEGVVAVGDLVAVGDAVGLTVGEAVADGDGVGLTVGEDVGGEGVVTSSTVSVDMIGITRSALRVPWSTMETWTTKNPNPNRPTAAAARILRLTC